MSESVFNNAIDLTDIPKDQWRSQYIGNGYRNVFYTTDHNREGRIILFGYDLVGNPKTFICPWQSWIKFRVKYATNEKDIFGNFVETKFFKSSYERKKRLDDIGQSLYIVECLRPEQEFLQEMFYKDCLDPNFNAQPMRVHFIDIETEISDVFMKPGDAGNRINMITIYDTLTKKYYTWSLEHAEIDFKEEPLKDYPKDKFVFFEFGGSEEALLNNFLMWIEDNYPDVSTGWNVKAYDWPYIVRRIENVLGKSAANRLSPVGKYRIKEVNHDAPKANVEAEIDVDISGLFIADDLVFYRDKFLIAPALDGGYNLSNVGEHEDLGKKIQYEGTLKDLYVKDYQKFYEYNVRDVDLVVKIEEKCKLINLARKVAGRGLCPYNSIYSSIGYLTGSLIAFSRDQMGKTFQSYLNRPNVKEEYEGAFVFPPVQDVYRGGIACVDFNSLYPSSIRASNMSIETYVGKVSRMNVMFDNLNQRTAFNKEEYIDLNDETINDLWLYPANGGKRKQVTRQDIINLVKTKCIYTRNNTLFLKHSVKQGVISAWCKHFYNLRKTTKKKGQALDLDIYKGKVPKDKIAEARLEVENLDADQHSLKIMLNSVYGMFGTNHSPIYSAAIAQSITRTGKFCNISASKFIKKRFTELFGIDSNYASVASGDTDSQFVNIQCVTDDFKKKYGYVEDISKWSDEEKLALWKWVEDFVEHEVNPFVQNDLIGKTYGTEHPEVLRYSLEYIGSTGIYERKKHYAVRKILSEGPEIVDKVKFSGIELKKASTPVVVKDFLKDIYLGVLKHDWKEHDFIDYINDAYGRFKQLTISDIAMWKGYNTAREAVGFLEMELGATGISKACTYYNQMLKHLKIGKKYDSIVLGQKIRFAYVLPSNEYGIECIAFHDGQWPKEFDGIFKVDYDVMFEKMIMSPLKGFLEATKFKKIDPRKQVVFDIFSL